MMEAVYEGYLSIYICLVDLFFLGGRQESHLAKYLPRKMLDNRTTTFDKGGKVVLG